MSDLVKRLRDGVGMQVGDWPVLIHEAADRIEALEARVAAADKLAERFLFALDELQECSLELTGEDYNCPKDNAALSAYEATKEQSDG